MTNHRAFIDALTTASSRAVAAIAGASSPDAALEAALDALVEATGDDAGWSIYLIEGTGNSPTAGLIQAICLK